MNNETYEQKCLQLDKELAELLGWEWSEGSAKYRTGSTWDTWEWIGRCGARNPATGACQIRWTQDDGEAFRLAVEYNIEINFPADGCTQCLYFLENTGYHCSECWYKDFPDKISAVRFAVVQATINKLKGTA